MKKPLAILLLLLVVGCGESEHDAAPARAQNNTNLTACPDCGKEVSTRAATCPHCGAPLDIEKSDKSEKDPSGKTAQNEQQQSGENEQDVPEGFLSISFDQLQPSETEKSAQILIPPAAHEYDGKKIFIQGYVHPGVDGFGEVKNFVLVAHNGICCFGGQPPLNHMIEVTLPDSLRIQYSPRRRGIGGVLRLRASPTGRRLGTIVPGHYVMDAHYIDP